MKFLVDLALSPKTVKQTFRKGLIEKRGAAQRDEDAPFK
jgi:hypothetical protein